MFVSLSDLYAWSLGMAILCSVALILVAAATLGRKLADYEFQVASGINGVRRIQAYINMRSNVNRISFGLVYLATTTLALTDLDIVYRTYISRFLFILLLAMYTRSAVIDWFDERKQMRILVLEDRDNRREDKDELQSFRDGVPERKSGSTDDLQPPLPGFTDAGDGSALASR